MPNAVCHLISDEEPKRHLKLFADEDGDVRFFATPEKESDTPVHLAAQCKSGSQTATYGIHPRASSTPTAEMPAAGPPKKQPRGRLLPALSEEEGSRLTDQELLKRGYPPRPDPKTEPQAFARWLNAFSKPVTMITPKRVANPEVRHDYSIVQQGTEKLRQLERFRIAFHARLIRLGVGSMDSAKCHRRSGTCHHDLFFHVGRP